MKTYLVALCRQLNSLAYGEATGARPKTGNQTDKHGHYTKETDDRKFKLELKKRNKRKAEIERWKQRALEIEKHYQEWEVKHLREINEVVEAVMIMTCTKVFELERKQARSARRSAKRAEKHPRPRNRDKIKIPAPPGELDKSSETYYTSTTESSDSIPEIKVNKQTKEETQRAHLGFQ